MRHGPPPPDSYKERAKQFRKGIGMALELSKPQRRLWGIGLLLLFINRLAGLVLPASPMILIDNAIPNKDFGLLYLTVGAIAFATIIQGLTSFGLTQLISKAGQRLIADLRKKIQVHVSKLPLKYFDQNRTGDVVSRIMNDVDGLRNLLGTGIVDLFGSVITAVLAYVILLFIDIQLTLLVTFFIAIFSVILAKAYSFLRPVYKKRFRLRGEINGRLTESIGGMRVVKSFHAEKTEHNVFAKGIQDYLDNILKTITATSTIALSSTVLVGVLGAVIALYGGHRLIAGTFEVGEFISYLFYMGIMVGPVSRIVSLGTQFSEVFAGMDRMSETMELETEWEEEKKKKRLKNIDGTIEFQNVSFSYDGKRTVLKDINFTSPAGTVTALVGPSGSGKSTMIGLIAAFHFAKEGKVFIDGHDISTVRLHDYRAQIGCVLQEGFLFSGTIAENIRYARQDATDEEVRQAAELANCMEFVEQFEDGFETVIGERGIKLSGGQRQRVAIARALLADPKILILDEATSALDTESEQLVQNGLDHLLEGRTTFVIAHRLSTIRHADQILVLDEGKLIEKGSHDELILSKGMYAEMVERQELSGRDLV